MLALIPLRAVWLLPPLVAGCLALASAAAATAPSKRDQRYSACEVRATDGKQPCTRSGKKGPRTTKGLVKGLQRQLDAWLDASSSSSRRPPCGRRRSMS